MKAQWWLVFGVLLICLPFGLLTYMLMPFPGSQALDSLQAAYVLRPWVRSAQIAGAALALIGLVGLFRCSRKRRAMIWTAVLIVVAGGVLYISVAMTASRIFRPMGQVTFVAGATEKIPGKTIVLGVAVRETAKAYPIWILAYHHLLEDEVDGQPVLITYCGMCRTARAFNRTLDGDKLEFTLVGASRYNAVIEDAATGSWWYQGTGRAVVGPLAGARLLELPLAQMTLDRWLELHPRSQVLQPDPDAEKTYADDDWPSYDKARPKSGGKTARQWIVAVERDGASRGYPWPVQSGTRLIQDELVGEPIAVFFHKDGFSHRVWSRRVGDTVLDLSLDQDGDELVDGSSGTSFGFDGRGRGGVLDGVRLEAMQCSLEYRRFFETFRRGELWSSGRSHSPEGRSGDTSLPSTTVDER
jgi:hypothetical protein